MKKRKLIKITVWSVSILFVLFTILAVHIYLVTKPVHYDNNDLQLSRIDFKEDIDSLEANKIKHFVVGLPGINNAMFNIKDRNLVYGYTLGKQSSENVFNKLMAFGHYKAERYIVSAEQLNTGCPMGMGKDKSALTYRISAYIYKCLN